MTSKELSQLYWLNREIEREQERLAELEAAATSTTAAVSGLPPTGVTADKTALAVEIACLRQIIAAKLQLAIAERNRLEAYIGSIEDSLVRQIMIARHINGLSWRQVAFAIGGGNTENGVRQTYHRYLKSCHKCHE